MRMLHECDSWPSSIFITLTYSDVNLPQNSSLVKEHFQLFIKRLRKRLENEGRQIKYFACGEYGDKNTYKQFDKVKVGSERPHYHAIIFGMSLEDEDKNKIMDAWPYADWSVASIRNNSFGLAEKDSINYVSQYIDKKLSGEEEEKFLQTNRLPVFRLLSQGIGKKHCLENSNQYVNNEKITMFGVNQSFPRYYLKLLNLEKSSFREERANQKSMDLVEYYTDLADITFDTAYRILEPSEIKKINDGNQKSKQQQKKNMEAKINLKKAKS